MTGLTPPITAVSVVRHGVLNLTFADGLSGEVDVLDRMWGPVFERARTPEGFAEASLDTDIRTVAWPRCPRTREGEHEASRDSERARPEAEEAPVYEADLAPDTLYERVRLGAWPNRDKVA
jgi:hypothetical protein